MNEKWKQLMFRCAGHVYVLRFCPSHGPAGADEALQAWVDNPELDFKQEDLEKLRTILGCVYQAYGP